jgi:hypothetical protein
MVTAPELSVPLEPGRFVRWLRGRNVWQLVLLALLADLAGRIFTSLLLVRVLGVKPDLGEDAPLAVDVAADLWTLVLVVIVGPLFETLIFQGGVQRGLGWLRFFRDRPGVLILITGGAFALMHRYSPFYMAMVLPTGLLLAAMFHALGAGWRALWIVFLTHVCMNSWVTVVGLIRHAAS